MSFVIKIISHEVTNGKVVYTVSIVSCTSSATKYVKYRYSELKDIHDRLQEMIDTLNLLISLPEFPKRRMFGVTNKSEEAITERKGELGNVHVGSLSTSHNSSK